MKMDLDHLTTEQSNPLNDTKTVFSFTASLSNITNHELWKKEDNNSSHLSIPDDWSYNYWPLIIALMPLITVGGNLLVIVSNFKSLF